MKTKLHVVLYGDSILKCDLIPKKHRWSNLLTKKLKKINNKKFVVSTKGMNGATSLDALSLLNNYVLKKKKDIIIFQFGINDSWYFKSLRGLPNVNQKVFTNNLKIMIRKCKKFNVIKIYFLTYHQVSKKRVEGNNKTINYNIKKYNSIIRSVVKKNKKVEVIDIENETKNTPSKLICLPKPDGVHLSKFGSLIYSNIIYSKLTKLLNL